MCYRRVCGMIVSLFRKPRNDVLSYAMGISDRKTNHPLAYSLTRRKIRQAIPHLKLGEVPGISNRYKDTYLRTRLVLDPRYLGNSSEQPKRTWNRNIAKEFPIHNTHDIRLFNRQRFNVFVVLSNHVWILIPINMQTISFSRDEMGHIST